jgi:hypothetical protein
MSDWFQLHPLSLHLLNALAVALAAAGYFSWIIE